jgi:uncharacterized membrane protein
MHSARANVLAVTVTLVTFVALDAMWLTLVAVPMFQARLSGILRTEPLLAAAIALYPIYAFGLVALAVRPAIATRSMGSAAIKGAVLGLTAYATFDLTSLAVIKGWTPGLSAIDMAWGVVASALASMAGAFAGLRAEPARQGSGEVRE